MLKPNDRLPARLAVGVLAIATCLGAFALNGCQRKERVVDVKTPIGDVKVDKTVKPNGETTGVEVNTEVK